MNLITINTDGLEECIRCILCKNNMKTGKGCDGNCVVDDSVLTEICNEISSRIDNKYRWHDLRKDPNDLPELYIRKELWFGGNLYSVGDFCGDYWNADLYRGQSDKEYRIPVIAWREIEPYEVRE